LDIGSNTARLLVADVGDDGSIAAVDEQRSYLRLGAEIERRGNVGRKKIAEAASVAGTFARHAESLGVERMGVIVTAPGRQGDSSAALVNALSAATGVRARVLAADEEGRLAYEGAIARAESLPEVIGVVDVGGGSTEIAVGTPLLGPAWVRSIDIGSLRLTRQHLAQDPPGRRAVGTARATVRAALDELRPPTPDIAFAIGGSARAIAKTTGSTLNAGDLDDLANLLARRPAERVLRPLGIDAARAETVLAGAVLLGETARLLGRPLQLARGGVREGAALELAYEPAEAAA
jgi:exopolyphosphatase/guanosine-5'-triphosphate,3'-diphosphate pyrophosphatase